MELASAGTARLWRPLLMAICACCVAINAVSLFTDDVEASSALGFQVTRTPSAVLVRVNSVDPGGAAAASGLRVGDLIHLRSLSPGKRYRLLTGVYPHERIPVVISRGQRTFMIDYRSGNAPIRRWDSWLWCAASFWLLAFAILIGWRRADSAEARILCVLLAFIPGGSGLMAGSWIGPSPLADLVAACIGYSLTWVSAALLASYALLFARPISFARRVLTALAYAAAAAIAIDEVVRLVLLWTGGEPWVAQTLGPDWNFAWAAIPYLLALACAWAAISAARGSERSRIAWSTATLGIYYLLSAMSFAAPTLLPSAARGSALVIAYSCDNVGALLAPLGMTYALLNRRLMDVGFALNRVAIFSAVSVIIVGIFVLAEWALSEWFSSASHTTNLAIGAVLALVLGLSVRAIHTRVDRVLDTLFFRKRHEDEQAIRMLAREAVYITDVEVLLSRIITTLEDHADASSAEILLDNGAGGYKFCHPERSERSNVTVELSVSENDPAIVRLRATGKVLDLHDMQSEISGELAYPMLARGKLVGALVLGPKGSGESYAPDESDAIAQLTHDAGAALDVLSTARRGEDAQSDALEEVRATNQALLRGMSELQRRIDDALNVRTTS